MHHSHNLPPDVVFDAFNLNRRKSAHDSLMRVPSLAVFKPSALIFITDGKESDDGNRRKRSSKYARIREFVHWPKEKSRKTSQGRIRNKLQKGIRVIKGVGVSKGEGSRRRSGYYAGKASGAGTGAGAGLGLDSSSKIRTSAAVADATTTSTSTTTATSASTSRATGRSTDRSTSTSSAEKSKANTAKTTQVPSTRPSTERPPLSPRVPVNSNKPLPSPPPPGTIDKVDGRPRKPVLKLNRIMAALTDTEIEKLFSGAPQFFARSQGHGTGAPHPSVAFPWNEELGIRDLTDHVQIGDNAWGCVTAWPRIILRDPLSVASPSVKKRPHFNARCQERPNMLSMQGLEKGTIGYQAALEISIADSLQEEQYGFDSLGSKGHVIVEQRQRLIKSKDGLRHLEDSAIMEQLIKCEERYQAERRGVLMKSQELYNELFAKVLYPPTRVIDPKDPYSLAVQIHALVKVLAAPNAWTDFSRVEWRIRLGQILWAFPLDDEILDGATINEGSDAQDRSEERYWLLLQILIACELLIRLDVITEGDECGVGQSLKASEIHRFEKEANVSVRWSLILARSWLENIKVRRQQANHSEPSTPKGWLSSLTSKMNLKHEHMYGAHYVDSQHRRNSQSEHMYAIEGKYSERQVYGLIHFARKLRWPDIQFSSTKLFEKAVTLGGATPVTTLPLDYDSRRSSYFSDASSVRDKRQPSRRRKIEAALHASGWFSKSYVSGLILPGEVLSHYLMSTLLEVDGEVLTRLGPLANLSGGFVYSGKSFWSTACIVGRVLAAGQGAAECMGWISSDVIPQGLGEGWVNIAVDAIPGKPPNFNPVLFNLLTIVADLARTGRKARIWGKTTIERESDVLGDADPSSVLPADFIIPYENAYPNPPPSNIRIDLKSLNLNAPLDSVSTTPTTDRSFRPFSGSNQETGTEIHTYPASVSFTMSHDRLERDEEHSFTLSNDVYFVTAHPCVASSYVKYFKSPTSPTIQQIDVGGHDFSGKSSSPAHITGFAPPQSPDMPSLSRMSSLSSSFGMEATNMPPLRTSTSLELERRPSTAASSLSKIERIDPPSSSPEAKMQLGTRRRQFGSDLEILVRAMCAERGWNAIISRRRRGCLSCAIREAGALGWKVIIRVE
ncbi:hypothetical protein Daesc_006932 [Daldinia eschscholtzii]|uniref:Uncharacterized protein n=1 Tax=Daldinia eschscholtzii TaxID=292717 RepID=A0AAX6MIU7_9PEZI